MPSVAILVFPGVQSLDVSGPLDVFAEANRFLLPADQYRLSVIGTVPQPMTCSNGMIITADRSFRDDGESYDLLLVAGGVALPTTPFDEEVYAWLRGASARAKRFGSICNGAFILGGAGLLDGKTVTTHWNDAATLAAMYPKANVEADRIFACDGNLYTSAGVTAGIDLSLYLLTLDYAAELALNVAKRLVVFAQRTGGQSQFSPYLTPYVEETSPVALVQAYVRSHLKDELSLDTLARVATMSSRNFSRVFARDAKVTPAEFVEGVRIDAARFLLESTASPVKAVAFECGFRDAHHLRAAFKRRLGVSPQQYRLSFSIPKS